MFVLRTHGHEQRLVAVAAHQRLELLFGDAREDGRVRDLVAVQMQDRKHGPVDPRVQEFVRMPARGQRARLGLAVADDTGNVQMRIVVCGSVSVEERVAELAPLVDRARHLRCDVARDTSRERELAEEAA